MQQRTLNKKIIRRHMRSVVVKPKPSIVVAPIQGGMYDITCIHYPNNVEYRQGAIRHNKSDVKEYVLRTTEMLAKRGIEVNKIYI